MELTESDEAWLETFIASQAPGTGTKIRPLRKNETLYAKGTPVTEICLIRNGIIRVNATGPDGEIGVHDFAGPGKWLPLRALAGLSIHVHTAVATEPSEVATFALSLFCQMRKDYPCLNRLLVDVMGRYITEQSDVIEDHLFHKSDRLLVRRLLQTFPVDQTVTMTMLYNMSMPKMAELIGCSHMTADRFVKKAEALGMMERKDKRTFILYRQPLLEYLHSENHDRDGSPPARPQRKTNR